MKKALVIISVLIVVVIGGALFLFYQFLGAFALPEIEITTEGVSTNRDFINGVNIERVKVDSIGQKGYPVSYTTIYTVSCNIQHPIGRPPDPPSRIEFNEPGDYDWDEDSTIVHHEHKGLSRSSKSTSGDPWWINKYGAHPTCPLRFEKEVWYYFTFGNPKVTGIFFYIEEDGTEKQYYLASGVSPI